jgi:hypothetical protein
LVAVIFGTTATTASRRESVSKLFSLGRGDGGLKDYFTIEFQHHNEKISPQLIDSEVFKVQSSIYDVISGTFIKTHPLREGEGGREGLGPA